MHIHRDGKGTEERKSILYLTTKHNPNQKQLEFAGCSVNWTASSGRLLCRWIATVMHYSPMAGVRGWQTSKYTQGDTPGPGNRNSTENNSHEAQTGLTNTLWKNTTVPFSPSLLRTLIHSQSYMGKGLEYLI